MEDVKFGWGTFNIETGVVTLNHVPRNGDVVELRKPRLGDLRALGTMLDEADTEVRRVELDARTSTGFDDARRTVLMILRGETPEGEEPRQPTGVEILEGVDLEALQAEYQAIVQRWLLGPLNPYPAIYEELLRRLTDIGNLDGDLPDYALSPTPIQLILAHMQNSPMAQIATVVNASHPLPRAPQDRRPKKSAAR